MFDKITALITLIVLIVLIYLVYRQNKKNEAFEDPEIPKTFIGMKKGDTKSLLFYNESNSTNDKYKIIKLPNNESIRQYLYEKGTMIVLTTDNKIFYCEGCDLISGNIIWSQIEKPQNITNISRIAFNNNKIFILDENGIIRTTNLNTSGSQTLWNNIEMPNGESSFKYMDAQYNHLVAIGSLTNFIYHKDITNGISANWTIIDKSKIMNSIKVTLHGYLGKTGPNELYQCKFPCDGSTDNMWNLINSDLTSSINANSEIISLVKNNTLFTCDKMCSPASMTPLTDPEKYSLFSGQVLDFIYPRIEILPTLAPLTELKTKLNNTDDKIKNKINEYQELDNNIDSINKKIQQFMSVQNQFDANFNYLATKRDKLVDEVMKNIGVSNVEKFEDQVLLQNIMNKVKEKVSVRSDEETKKGIIRSNLIVSL